MATLTSDMALALNRKATELFIESDPTLITLIPSTETFSGGTKTTVDGNARDEQTFKVIWPGGTGIVTNSTGTTRKLDFILVGYWDAEVAIGDHWQIGTQRYRIEYIEPSNGYEVKCGGVSVGAHP